ncbi:MAG: flagellar assembly peptidoglycan hydrolase FlgJ [Candidatus Thiodiazotropha sp.]
MAASATSLYNDFSGLAALKYQARKDQSGSADKVARQFESLFMQMMVKQMRQASFGDGIFDSDRTRFYQEMYDKQLSLQLAEQGGMGMHQVLARQLGGEAAQPSDQGLSGLEPYRRHPVFRAVQPPTASDATAPAGATTPSGETDGSPAQPAPETPQDFIDRLWSSAEQAAGELGLPPEALLAQAALETGWGSYVMPASNGASSHNLFGIKADGRWDGAQVRKETLEYEQGVAVRRREYFRTYDSFEQSFSDYVAFLKSSPRYAEALQKTDDPAAYFRSLQAAGYATDPAYADKILRVMQGPEMQAALASFKASS